MTRLTAPPRSKSRFIHRSLVAATTAAAISLASMNARADLTDLQNAGLLSGYNEIRLQSAIATQLIYDQLQASGCLDNDAIGSVDTQPASCSGNTFLVWRNVREVIHNANVITLQGQLPSRLKVLPTRYTLGRNTAQLGGALQWCNGEEFASLNSLSTSFISTQASSLASRITALRFGASGMHASNLSLNDGHIMADASPRKGGGASADGDDDYDNSSSAWSTWGLFGNGNYVKGEKIPTGSEEGFKYKGNTFNLGVDKRFNQNWVAGVMVGYQKNSMDFTPFNGTLAVGSSDLKGLSILPYAMYETDRWYFNLSLGYQNIKFDTSRLVNYGTQPGTTVPVAVSHQTSDQSTAHATGFSSYDTVGVSFRPFGAMTIEPSVSFDYQHTRIGQFTEQDLNNQGFAFVVDAQTINSLEGIPELRLQYTFTPRFGVWSPYIDAQWHHQFNANPRSISTIYADAQNILTPAASFNIKTEALDPWYQVYSAGISAVIRGSSAGQSHSTGGMQLYANYRRYEGLKNYTQQIYTLGLRYEF
jgi:uncharacterized protein with beta-barrel porin domain